MTTTARTLVRYGWSVLCWIVLSGFVAGLVAALYYYHRADHELTRLLEEKLAEAYPDLDVRVGAAKIMAGEGIRVDQLAFVQRPSGGSDRRSELAYVDRLMVHGDVSLPALIRGDLALRRVTVEGLVLHGSRQHDGRWNLDQLVPQVLPPCRGQQLPQIAIRGAEVTLRDESDEAAREVHVESIDLTVKLKRLSVPQTPGELPELLAAMEGSCRTSFCRTIQLAGVARTTDGAWTVRGELADLLWSADVAHHLPASVAQLLQPLNSLRGRASVQFEVGSSSREHLPEYRLAGRFQEGTWHDPRLPQAITEIDCQFSLEQARFAVNELRAQLGESLIHGSMTLEGHDLRAPLDLRVHVERFPLTRRVAELLPPKLLATWEKFQAAGLLSGSLRVVSDSQQYRIDADVQCEEMAIQHYKFPYPLAGCRGTVSLRGDQLRFELDGFAGGTPIEMNGTIHQPGRDFTGWWEVKTTRWKAIDEHLIAALPPKATEFVRQLQLRGNVGFWVRQDRRDASQPPPLHIVVSLDQGWISYAPFPYAVSSIRGELELKDGNWNFRNLQGWNDGSRIRCDGVWQMHAEDAPLELQFALDRVNLDAELKQALRPASQRIWDQFRPQGELDRVDVTLFKTKSMPSPDLDIRIRHRPDLDVSQEPRGEGLQLHPRFFPLRLTQARGEARIRDGVLVLTNFMAKHGKVDLRANATARVGNGQAWQVNLTELLVERVELTETILAAFPTKLQQACRRLKLGGTFALRGGMLFERQVATEPVASSWDLKIGLDQGHWQAGWPVEHVFGEVTVRGGSRGNQFWSKGELLLDSLISQKVQLTQIRGPYSLDTTRLQLGTLAAGTTPDVSNQPLTAQLYGGQIRSSAEVWLNDDAPFNVQLDVVNASLSTLARDWQLGRGNLAGDILAQLHLSGSARGRHTLRGNGTAQLRQATLYELPLILALLNRLSSGRRDNAAFNASDIAFHIRDGYVYFTRFDLSGDAITLKGFGDMSLDREIRLDFYSLMGREQLWSPLVQPFLRETSRQFLQIHVDGTLSNPRTTQEVLPGLNETLQQLFPEQATATPPPATSQTARPRFGIPR